MMHGPINIRYTEKIYILSSGSKEVEKKEAGTSGTSSLTCPHCILVYAKIALCIVS